ncbi:MAG TPA: hypothetical protein VM141_00200 [Planctomycetota bacterium]|nr:hypothetical protein [Planctomycetota bacterium]
MKKLILLAMLSCGGLCQADLIRFKDNIELGGPNVQILARTGDRITVLVNWGKIELDAARVAMIRIDYKDRMLKMKTKGDDTVRNLFDLAVLCDQSGMTLEASEAYALILRKPAIPEEMLRRLTEVFQKRELWPEAKAAYEKLLLTNPADKALQDKAQLAAEKAAGATPLLKPDTTDNAGGVAAKVDPAVEPENTVKPVPPKENRDGMEANNLWRIEQWGNNATCEVVVNEDNKLLQVNHTGKDKDKVALRLNVDMSLADKTKVTFDIYNDSGAPAGICMAFNTLPGYQFFESMAFDSQLKTWKKMEIDLQGKKFKSAASNWKYVTDILNKDDVKDIFILIYNRDATGKIYIDNIRFHTADEGK